MQAQPATAQSEPLRFITFEGGEGAGKSTQVRLLAERLRLSGQDCITTREPGGSPDAEALREVLLSGAAHPLGPMAEALLFAAARIDHLDKTIRPALARGAFVVCDRFTDSTRVYQGALGNIEAQQIRLIEAATVGPTRPEITFILDLPAQTGLERAASRRGQGAVDRFEAEDMAFHRGLREAFLSIAAEEPGRCIVVDASQPPQAIADEVWAVVQNRFGLREPDAERHDNSGRATA